MATLDDLAAQPGFQDADPVERRRLIAAAISTDADFRALPPQEKQKRLLSLVLPGEHPANVRLANIQAGGDLPGGEPTPAPVTGPGIGGEGFLPPAQNPWEKLKGLLPEVEKFMASGQRISPDVSIRTGRPVPEVAPFSNEPLIPAPPAGAIRNAISPPGAPTVESPTPFSMRTGREMPPVAPPTAIAAGAEGLARGASQATTPSNVATIAALMAPGLGEVVGPAVLAKMGMDVTNQGGEMIGQGASPEQFAEAGGELAGGLLPMAPGIVHGVRGSAKAPAGLSVESIDTPGKLLPRTRGEMFKVGAALLHKTGPVDTPTFSDMMQNVFTPNVPDGWQVASDARGEKIITPEVMHAGSKAALENMKSTALAGGGELTPHDRIEARTNVGIEKGGKDWYPGLMKEIADKYGEDTVHRLIRTESIVSPNQKVETSVGQALSREERNLSGPDAQFGRYPNQAEAQYASDITPRGPKVEPYDYSKRQALSDALGPEAKIPVGEEPPFFPIDTVHMQGSGFKQTTSASLVDTIRAFSDAQLRMEARRVLQPGERGSAAQASNWVGTQQDLFGRQSGKVTPWAKLVMDEVTRREDQGRQVLPTKGAESFDFGANQAVGLGVEHVKNPEVGKVADEYNDKVGLPPTRDVKPQPIDIQRARAIARAYDAMPKNDPRAKPAYDALRKEVDAQWNEIQKAGYTLEPWNREGQPYKDSAEMLRDVRENKHLFFFQGGEPHPFLGEVDPRTGLSANDRFRAVHDFFGHAKNGLMFGPKGEEAAWASHVQMFSPLAAKAMTSETRGQNSWVNFGPHNPEKLPMTERPYADQKAALLPDEFTQPAPPDTHATTVKLKDGRVLESAPVPMSSRNLPSHLQVLEHHGVDASQVADTGFKIGDEYQWDSGGGTVGRGAFTLGEYEAKRGKTGLSIEHVGDNGENLPDRVGALNLARLGLVEEQKKFIRDRGSELEKVQKHITFDEIRDAANEMGYTLADSTAARDLLLKNRGAWLAARDVGVTLAAEREAAFQNWKTVSEKGAPREIELAAQALDKATERAMTGLVASAQIGSELGRGLATQRIAAMQIPAYRYQKALSQLLERMKDKSKTGTLPESVTTMLRSVDLSDQATIRRFILAQSPKIASWNDKFYEFWVSMLLSNPTTHFRNTIGNAVAMAGMPIESLAAASFGAVKQGVTLGKVPRQTYFGEAPAQIYGFAHGLQGAWKGFVEGMKGEAEAEAKLEYGEGALARAPKIAGLKGEIIRTPLRALQAADNASKALVRSASIYEQAYRLAVKDDLHGTALLDRAQEIAKMPTEDMLTKAQDEAEYRSFQRKLGHWGQAALNMRSMELGRSGIKPLMYIAPFMTTPVNLLKYGTERTPLEWLAVAKRGFSGEYKGGEGQRRAESDVGRAVIGSIIAQQVWSMVQSGDITGSGPTDQKERRAMQDAGWSPYSIRVGNRWVPISNFDPASTSIMLAADTAEIWSAANAEERKKLAGMIGRAYGNNVQQKTFLSGITTAMDAIDDPDRYLEKWAGRQAASMVPAAVAGATKAMDPYERESRTLVDQIKARVPGLREGMMPRRDLRGKPLPAAGTGVIENKAGEAAFRWLSPAQPTGVRGGEIERLVAQMGSSVPDVPRRLSIQFPSQSNPKKLQTYQVDLEPEEYDVYQQFRGELMDTAFSTLEKNKKSQFWEKAEQDKKEYISRLVNATSEISHVEMIAWLAQNGRLPTKYADALQQEAMKRKRSFMVSIKGGDNGS